MRPRGARIAGALEGQDANGDGGARATAPREVEAVITKQDAGFARRFRGPHAALGGGRLAARAVPPTAGAPQRSALHQGRCQETSAAFPREVSSFLAADIC